MISCNPEPRRLLLATAIASATTLAACGGGGGSGSAETAAASVQAASTEAADPVADDSALNASISGVRIDRGIGSTVKTVAPGYYVDSIDGDDNDAGTILKPWKTLAKARSVSLKTGEGLYLRCGAVWRESLDLDWTRLADGSKVAGYGDCTATNKATISGAISLDSGWVKNGNIWSRAVPPNTPKIARLYVGNEAHRVARWPNFTTYSSDFAVSDSGAAFSTGTLRAAAADRAALRDKDLNGASVQVRSTSWQIEARQVAGNMASDGTLPMSSPTTYTPEPGSGYVLQNKLWMLDAPGEFFHDTATNTVYVYPATAAQQANMNGLSVEGSIRKSTLSVKGAPNLLIQNLAFTMSAGDGFQGIDAPGIQVRNVTASRNVGTGIVLAVYDSRVVSTLRSVISDSTVSENWLGGINGRHQERLDITNTTVSDSGLVDNVAWSDAAINVGDSSTVIGNVVRNSAYHGISFTGTGGSSIKSNHISGYCIRLTDCGAIYTWNGPKQSRRTDNQSSIVEGNQVLDATANMQGAVGGGDVVGGVYLDDYTLGVTVRGNWITGVPVGVFLHNASGITVTQNRLWLSTGVGLNASMDQSDGDYMAGNAFTDNEFVRIVKAQGAYPNLPTISADNTIAFYHYLYGAGAITSGANVFSGNRHVEVNGTTTAVASVWSRLGGQQMTAAEWRALNPAEAALQTPYTFATNAPVLGPELILGGQFTNGIGPWYAWFGTAPVPGSSRYLSSSSGCDGGCMQLTASTSGDMLVSPTFSMTPGVPHLVSYNAVFGNSGTVGQTYISRSGTPYDSMTDATGYISVSPRTGAAGTSLRYEAYFMPKSNSPAQINLQLETLGTPVAFDNVSIKAVTGFSLPAASEWQRVAHASRTADLTVDCAYLGWSSGCTVGDSSGAAVTLPARVPAGTSRLFFRTDSSWRR